MHKHKATLRKLLREWQLLMHKHFYMTLRSSNRNDWNCFCLKNKSKRNPKESVQHLSQAHAQTHRQTYAHALLIVMIEGLDCWFLIGFCSVLVWSWYYCPACFLPWVSWLKSPPVNGLPDRQHCLTDSHAKHTCHNPRPPTGYCGSPVSKATLECRVFGTAPFRKEPHVNKAGMWSTVCSVCGKQSVTVCRHMTSRITCCLSGLCIFVGLAMLFVCDFMTWDHLILGKIHT